MINNLYTVFDSKTAAYLQPFFSANDETAIRSMANCFYQSEHPFLKNTEDYTLFYLGDFDDQTAHLASLPPKLINTMLEIKSQFDAAMSVVDKQTVLQLKQG